jgi:hypothetical protein
VRALPALNRSAVACPEAPGALKGEKEAGRGEESGRSRVERHDSVQRAHFVQDRLDGLVDEPRPGRPPTITAEQTEEVVVGTLESIPKNATHWSRAKMANRVKPRVW